MNRQAWCALVGVFALVAAVAVADDQKSGSKQSSRTIGDNPYSVGGGQGAQRSGSSASATAQSKPTLGDNPGGGKSVPTRKQSFVYPYVPYGYGNGYPYWNSGYPYYLGPQFVPSGTLYGPQTVQRFMGADGATQPGQRATATARSRIAGSADDADSGSQRGTSGDARNTAWRFITLGDIQFSNGKYKDAYERYKKAAETAPAMAEPLVRQGFAMLGAGRYELAAKAFKKGVALDPEWPRSNWTLDELYAKNQAAKTAADSALAAAAGADPNNADLLFLAGVFMHFDGKVSEAADLFKRAARIDDGEHLRSFLRGGPQKMNPGGDPPPKP